MKNVISIFIVQLLSITFVNSQDVRSQLRQIANDLTKQIETKGKKRIAVAAFLDLQNRETELGRYMADKFSLGLSNNPNLEVLDRSQLSQLMEENKFGAKSILDPKTIPALGKIDGVEVFITGNYAPLDNSIDLTVKIIDSQRAVRLGGIDGVIARTPEVNKLLEKIDTNLPNSNTDSSEKTSDLPNTPAADCKAKNLCTVCIKNAYSEPIESDVWIGSSQLSSTIYIHPNQVKCWNNIPLETNQEHRWIDVWYKLNGQYIDSKTDKFIVERCKVYNKSFSGK